MCITVDPVSTLACVLLPMSEVFVSLVLEVVLESRLLPVDGEDVRDAVGLEAVLVFRRLLHKQDARGPGIEMWS